jgi:hypothetical protein
MRTSKLITICYLCSQGIELLGGRLAHVPCGRQLPFANRMHDFHTGDCTPRCPKGLEAQHWMSDPFHASMILFHDIIQIFTMTNDNPGLVRLVVVRDRCRIGPTLIDRDFLRHPLAAKGFAQEGFGRGSITIGRQEKINRVALFVDRTLEVGPLGSVASFHLRGFPLCSSGDSEVEVVA